MSVRVVARIRPLLGKELDKDTIVRAESSEEGKPTNIVRIPNPKNEVEEFSFTFNSVYDMETTQEELFTQEVAPTLKSLFQGLDVTLFAYGVTGTGKTHTMRGGLKLSERGAIPRLLSGIFRRGRKVAKDTDGETTVSVMLSYYEIYCDKVFDLFQPLEKRTATPAGLPLREKDGRTIVVGLSERECGDLKEFEKLYIEANNNRVTAATKLNAQSSRSHAILMVKVIQTTGDEVRTSTASAIDLAGSEDNRRTDNGKERLVESASINKSLFVLSQCIDAIGRGDKRIPYRESKMTRILSLGQNNGITVMILNLAPLRSYHLDTLSSLNVSSRAKRIEVREIENEVVFKQPPRTMSSISGSNIQRQPLRPLANAHNVNITIPTGEKKGDKPSKAFSVYSDKNRNARANNTAPLKDAKRPLDTQMNTRPSKMVRSNTSVSRTAAEMSAAKIEEMVERKVSEILAKKAKNEPAPVVSTDTLSEAVQRRLEALEKKIEDGEQEETRAEGLRFLLMAKQHKERGEDSSALKMYELALPYFPGQDKLIKKMDNLRAKIRAKKEVSASTAASVRPQSLATAPIAQQSTPPSSFQEEAPRRRHKASDDDDFAPLETHDELGDYEDDSFIAKPKAKKRSKALKVFTDTALISHDGPPSPRTAHLLDIVNSRDVAMIKGLVGIGAKKARDLVEFLEFQNEEDGGRIDSLRQLENVPGMGRRGVERAYEGLALLA